MKQVVLSVAKTVSEKLLNGDYGKSGEAFMTVKMLSKEYNISVESAFRVFKELSNRHLIRLNGKRYYITTGYVSPETPYGSLLASSRKKSFGMIVNRIESPLFSVIVRELSNAAESNGYSLYVMCSNNDPIREKNMIEELIDIGVCGIFSNPGLSVEIKDTYRTCPIPVVSILRDLGLDNCDSVLIDNENAGKQVAEHLMNCGCTQYAYVGITNYLNDDPRLKGYVSHLRNNGFEIDKDHILVTEHNRNGWGTIESVSGQLKMILKMLPNDEKLGIFCYHDMIAAALMQWIRIFGNHSTRTYNIPADVSVVGFDDLPVSETIQPSLTSVHYMYNHIVNKAMDLMLDYIDNPQHIHNSCIIPSSLFIRRSTMENAY